MYKSQYFVFIGLILSKKYLEIFYETVYFVLIYNCNNYKLYYLFFFFRFEINNNINSTFKY